MEREVEVRSRVDGWKILFPLVRYKLSHIINRVYSYHNN